MLTNKKNNTDVLSNFKYMYIASAFANRLHKQKIDKFS